MTKALTAVLCITVVCALQSAAHAAGQAAPPKEAAAPTAPVTNPSPAEQKPPAGAYKPKPLPAEPADVGSMSRGACTASGAGRIPAGTQTEIVAPSYIEPDHWFVSSPQPVVYFAANRAVDLVGAVEVSAVFNDPTAPEDGEPKQAARIASGINAFEFVKHALTLKPGRIYTILVTLICDPNNTAVNSPDRSWVEYKPFAGPRPDAACGGDAICSAKALLDERYWHEAVGVLMRTGPNAEAKALLRSWLQLYHVTKGPAIDALK